MATSGLVDYLTEKLYYFSSKMWGSSLQSSSTSFLMNGNTNFQQYDLSSVLAEVRDRNYYPMHIQPDNKFFPFHKLAAGILGLRQSNGLDKFNNLNYMTEKETSPYFFNFVADHYQAKYGFCDPSLVSPDSKLPNLVRYSAGSESHMIKNQMTEIMKKERDCKPQVIEMSLSVSHSPTKKKSDTMKESSDISPTMRLNIELAHRKAKEMSKRSKKRRRRQKKSEHINISSSTSASDDDTNNKCNSEPITDSLCFLSKSPDFECSLSVTHTVQFSPRNSFLISVTSDSEDDSDWETFEEIDISAANNVSSNETDSDSSSSNSSPIKCKNFKSSSFKPVGGSVKVSSIISFVVPEGDTDDEDDSDWDKCETVPFPENTDFEFSGLYFTNLCTPQNFFKCERNSESAFEENGDEKLKQRAVILEANDKWNELVEGQKLKSPSKVTFAPDEDLVKIFPVEIYDRKGEWETYVTARDRFKRKVNELEKIISPCLTPEHRSKIFKKIIEPQL